MRQAKYLLKDFQSDMILTSGSTHNPSTICDVNLNQLEEIVVFIKKKMAVLKTM